MDFKIIVKCHACKCCFEFRPTDNLNPTFSCPNCKTDIDSEVSRNLLSGISSLGKVPEEYHSPDDKEFCKETGFSFKVVEKPEDIVGFN